MTDVVNAGRTRRVWLVPAALIALSLVPMVAGGARMTELARGAPVTAENERFFEVPVPVVVHIISASLYLLVGAFQFLPGLRRTRWHRMAGRVLVPLGIAAAVSGLWMSVYYDLPPYDGDLLQAFRLFFGVGMVLAILLGLTAALRRDFVRHRAWMMRGYAIGLGAGTQVWTLVPWLLMFGVPGEFTRAMLMAAGWVINLVVAEWIIRSRPLRQSRTVASLAEVTLRTPESSVVRELGRGRFACVMQLGADQGVETLPGGR